MKPSSLKRTLTSCNTYSRTDFTFLNSIGRGAYAEVILAEHKADKQLYAIKIINKISLKLINKTHSILIEKEILKFLKHPNVIKYYGSF